MIVERFKTPFAETIFRNKYAQGPNDSWDALADRLVDDVCGSRGGTTQPLLSEGDRAQLSEYIKRMQFIPGGRYLYYAGRPYKSYNNCFLLRAEEDTREEWSSLMVVLILWVTHPSTVSYFLFNVRSSPYQFNFQVLLS